MVPPSSLCNAYSASKNTSPILKSYEKDPLGAFIISTSSILSPISSFIYSVLKENPLASLETGKDDPR